MGSVDRRIGLSLGADICWPICFEEVVKRLDLRDPVGGRSRLDSKSIASRSSRSTCGSHAVTTSCSIG